MRPLAVLAVALLLLAAAPVAEAQSACGPLSLSLAPQEGSVAPGGTATFAGTVQNRATLPGALGEGTARLLDETAPEGWTVTFEPENVTLAAQAQGSFTMTVAVPAGETSGGEVQARWFLDCGPGRQSAPVPATVEVRLAAEGRGIEDVAGLAAEWAPFLLAIAALGGLAAAAVVGSRAVRRGFAVEAPEPLKSLRPGRGTSFPIVVENRARAADTAHFEVGNVPEGWTAFTALPEVPLAPGEKRTLWLMVRAPGDAAEGTTARIALTVKSDAYPGRTSTRTVTAEVRDVAEEQG